MKRNLNRRKIFSFNKIYFYFIFFTIVLTIIISILYFQKKDLLNYTNKSIDTFSKIFDYQFVNYTAKGILKVNEQFIEKRVQKYYDSSIFLLPLESISNELKENSWVKNIKLNINYKDTLIIEIEEYNPIGIYDFNNKKFYFDSNGKIIEEVKKIHTSENNLILFTGKSSNLKAKYILDIINNLSFHKKFNIKKIVYIKNRRWDLYLKNGTKLMLSENYPEISLKNFIKIENNLSKTDMNNINYLDLRNITKTLITYIND